MHNGTSLTQFIIEEQRRIPGATGDFTSLLNDIVTACKVIANAVSKGGLIGILGTAGSENVQGETQKKLDVIANDVLVRSMEWTGHLAAMASEEMEDIYRIPGRYPRGKYLLLFDPLDGSSNIDVNVSVGTIFSVLRCPEGVEEPAAEHFLQPGTQQVCAGYAIYGPSTMLVLTTGHGVNGFTLDREIGEFVLTHPDMQIPAQTSEFAINVSNERFWEARGRGAPHPHPRRHLHVPLGPTRPRQARAPAPHVRGEPDGDDRRAGGRGAPAGAGGAGLARGGRARGSLPPRARRGPRPRGKPGHGGARVSVHRRLRIC